MDNPAIENVVRASTPHELIVAFLEREKGITPEQYDALYLQMVQWAATYPHKGCVNSFSPIMLLEQVRQEFDPAVDFVLFALVAADLQWGPRLMKMAEREQPIWVLALEGFPAVIASAQEKVRLANEQRE